MAAGNTLEPLFWPVSIQGVVVPIRLLLDIHHGASSWSFLPAVFDALNAAAVAWEATVMGAFLVTRAFVARLRR